jgi:hypothetical protein
MEEEIHKQYMSIKDENERIEFLFRIASVIQNHHQVHSEPVVKGKLGVRQHKGERRGDMYNELMGKQTVQKMEVTCIRCASSNIYYDSNTGDDICMDCASCRPSLSGDFDYNDEKTMDKTMVYSYKRENHFNEWINQFQAKENTTLPPTLMSDVKTDLSKQRLRSGEITHKKVKESLKKLGYNKYYEHVPYITTLLHGTKPPVMSPELEEKLRNMFQAIQAPFDKFCPNERINFLSYSYILYKFCELLGHDEYLDFFPLLKSREKLYKHDQIWKRITDELKWEWIPTI